MSFALRMEVCCGNETYNHTSAAEQSLPTLMETTDLTLSSAKAHVCTFWTARERRCCPSTPREKRIATPGTEFLRRRWSRISMVMERSTFFLLSGEGFTDSEESSRQTTGAEDMRCAWAARAKAGRRFAAICDVAGAQILEEAQHWSVTVTPSDLPQRRPEGLCVRCHSPAILWRPFAQEQRLFGGENSRRADTHSWKHADIQKSLDQHTRPLPRRKKLRADNFEQIGCNKSRRVID